MPSRRNVSLKLVVGWERLDDENFTGSHLIIWVCR